MKSYQNKVIQKNVAMNYKSKVLALTLLVLFLLWLFSGDGSEETLAESWVVQEREIASIIYQNGILSAKDKYPVMVGCEGNILEITETGTSVKKGDIVLSMDEEDILDRINNAAVDIERLELDLEINEQELQFIEYEKIKRLEILEERLKHALLVEEYEKSKPLPHELREMKINEELARIELKNAELDLQSNERLFEKGFLAQSALEPFRLRKKTAETFLNETLLKNSILKQGITQEQRVEYETLVNSARANLERTKQNFKRSIERKKQQIDATKKRLHISQIRMQKNLEYKQNATTTAQIDGIFVRRTYIDWSAGGISTEFKPGLKRWPLDIVADVIDPTKMEIQVAFNEADYHLLEIGMKVEVILPAVPNEVYDATIVHLGAIAKDRNKSDPTANISGNSGVMTYRAKIELHASNPKFRPGMSAQLKVFVKPSTKTTVIPRGFLREKNGKLFVNRGSGYNHEVTGNISDTVWFEVSSGLNPGDKIYR